MSEIQEKKIKENSYPPPTFSNDLRSKRKCLTFSCQYLFLKNLLFSQYYNHTIHVLINIAIWVSSSENERFCTRILWRTWESWARPGTIAHQAKVPASELRIWCGLMGPIQGEPASTSCPPASTRALQQAPGGWCIHVCTHRSQGMTSEAAHPAAHHEHMSMYTHTYRKRKDFYCLKYIFII